MLRAKGVRVLLLPDGEQLQLKLKMPWDGVSPRYLTRGFSARSLLREGLEPADGVV